VGDFGSWIKAKREEKEWSQIMMSEETGIPQTTISGWERGETTPSLKHIPKLVHIFQVKYSEIVQLIGLDQPEPKKQKQKV